MRRLVGIEKYAVAKGVCWDVVTPHFIGKSIYKEMLYRMTLRTFREW